MISLEIVRFTSVSRHTPDGAARTADPPPGTSKIIDFLATVDKTALGASLGTLCGSNGAPELPSGALRGGKCAPRLQNDPQITSKQPKINA